LLLERFLKAAPHPVFQTDAVKRLHSLLKILAPFEERLERETERVTARIEFSKALIAEGFPEEAEKVAREAVEISPESKRRGTIWLTSFGRWARTGK